MSLSWIRTFLSEKKEAFICWKNRQKAISFFRWRKCKLLKPRHCLFSPKQLSLGENIRFDSGARIDCYTPEARISIGKSSFFSYNVSILAASKINIGSNCLFASYVFVSDENHVFSSIDVPFIKQGLSSKPITIGNNVWLGERVIVLPGVSIGDNSVIGAGSVVVTNIPENSVAVGNPAKVIKRYDKLSNKWERV